MPILNVPLEAIRLDTMTEKEGEPYRDFCEVMEEGSKEAQAYITDLADSIHQQGMVQMPMGVRQGERVSVMAGGRRVKAAVYNYHRHNEPPTIVVNVRDTPPPIVTLNV